MKLIKTGAYVRVSHDEQKKHGFSVEAQKEGLQKYANEKGYLIVDWYIDEGFSARKKSKTRKELTRLLEDAKLKKFELIIFKCIDRWFRNIAEYHKTQDILEDNKIGWECSEEDIDTTTRDGRLKLNLYLMLAQDEADRTSERIKYVFDNKIKNGEAIYGTHNTPFGFKLDIVGDKKRITTDESLRHIVNDIFDTYETTHSKRKTLFIINEKYNLELTYKYLINMFNSTLYYGSFRDNPNYVYGKSFITKDRWDKIQAIMKTNNKTTSTKRDYVFSGLIKCPNCNRTLSGVAAGNETLYYRCNGRAIDKTCDFSRNISETKLEETLVLNIKKELGNYLLSVASIKEKKTPKPKIDINELKKEQDRLNKIYRKNRISEEEYDEEYEIIERKIANANIEVFKPKDLSYLKDLLESDISNIYSQLQRQEKVYFWRSIIKSMVVNPDTYELTGFQPF